MSGSKQIFLENWFRNYQAEKVGNCPENIIIAIFGINLFEMVLWCAITSWEWPIYNSPITRTALFLTINNCIEKIRLVLAILAAPMLEDEKKRRAFFCHKRKYFIFVNKMMHFKEVNMFYVNNMYILAIFWVGFADRVKVSQPINLQIVNFGH